MPAKKPLKAAPVENVGYPTGAPDSAKRLEAAEALAAAKRERLEKELERLEGELKQVDGDEEETKKMDDKITRAGKALILQTKMWLDIVKQVGAFYKTVDETKREGEKILRAEVERLLEQSWRFQRVGREAFVIGIAQDAIHCKDEKDFYAKYAELIRGCEADSLQAGIENSKFPAWVLTCYASSL